MPLTAGERRRTAIHQFFDPAESGRLGQPVGGLFATPALETETNIGCDIQVGEEAIILEDHSEPAPAEGLVDPVRRVEENGAVETNVARVGCRQAGDQSQQRCLAGSGSSEEDADLTAQTEGDVDHQAGMNPACQLDVEDPVKGLVHRGAPRDGKVRWTKKSAVMETSEIKRVSQPARAVSLTRTAS